MQTSLAFVLAYVSIHDKCGDRVGQLAKLGESLLELTLNHTGMWPGMDTDKLTQFFPHEGYFSVKPK